MKQKTKTICLTIQVEENFYKELKRIAEIEDRSKAAIIRKALHNYLASYYNEDN